MTKQVDIDNGGEFCKPTSDPPSIDHDSDETILTRDRTTDRFHRTESHSKSGKGGGPDGHVKTWEKVTPPPPPFEETDEDRRTPFDSDFDKLAQVDVIDANDNLAGSIRGLNIDLDDFLDNLSDSVPSEQRYAYWVSLLDGDLLVNGSKVDDDGIEIGAGGTATVNAGKGDDTLYVWHQKNVIFNGGKGIDLITFSPRTGAIFAAPSGAVVDLGAGTGTNPFGGTLTLVGVENAAGAADAANTLIGSDKANQLIAGSGADTIKGLGGDDTITITQGYSALTGMNVDGGAGKDELIAPLTNSTTFTGSGATLRYINILDLQTASNNSGAFAGGTFAGFEIYRATNSDTSTLQYYVFDFRGSDSGEAAIGSGGDDSLQGRGGNDTLRGGAGADTIDGGDGRDVADYSDNNFAKIVAKINGASTTITVNGVQQDTLISIEGAKGGGANDKLTGDAGANEFDGGLGNDILAGKGGKDHFVFSTALGPANIDTIKDFTHGKDKIDLDDAIFAALGPTVTSGEFIKVSSGHAAKQSDDRLIYNTADGTLWFDSDGTGKKAAVQFAVLTGSPDDVTFKDFHIV